MCFELVGMKQSLNLLFRYSTNSGVPPSTILDELKTYVKIYLRLIAYFCDGSAVTCFPTKLKKTADLNLKVGVDISFQVGSQSFDQL